VILDSEELREDLTKALRFTFIKQLCNLSGGEAILVPGPFMPAKIPVRISSFLNNEYDVEYFPRSGLRDGKWHSVKVKVDVPFKFRPAQVLVRSGYFGLKPSK